MRKLKVLMRNALSPCVCEELETWVGVLLALGAALLIYATLKGQAAHAAEFQRMAAGARGTPWHEESGHAVRAPGMPPVASDLVTFPVPVADRPKR